MHEFSATISNQRFFRLMRSVITGLILIFLLFEKSFADGDAVKGEKLFKQNCTACHKAYPFDAVLVGPALKDIEKKQSEDWLIKWIHNNNTFRASGDKDAIAVYEQYQKKDMPSFTQFSDDDVRNILSYIKNGPPQAAPKGPLTPGTEPTPQTDWWIYAVLLILIVVALVLVRTNGYLRRLAYEKAGETISEPTPWKERLKSKKAIALYILIIVFAMGFTLADSAMRLGHSKNYSPVQPIKFPHSVHAGIAQINCLYCHAGAEKSRTAGIPPVSTCMNCHKGIQAGQTDAGTAEIQKIYAAYDNNQPIHWIKIHNLPDHVYFNHSQHVVAGKIACQTCHGPVEKMDQVYQYASLSMGWCVNCHRQTKVQFDTNGYYTGMYEKWHEEIKEGKLDSVTAAMQGAAECQKCHY